MPSYISLLQSPLNASQWLEVVPQFGWEFQQRPDSQDLRINTPEFIRLKTCPFLNKIYHKSTDKPPGRVINFKFIWNTFAGGGGGGAIETGDCLRGGGTFNLAKWWYEELEDKVEKLKHKKLEVMQLRIKNKSELQLWLINTVNHSLVKNNRGQGRGLLTFLPSSGRSY